MKKLIICLSLMGFVFIPVLISGCGKGGSELTSVSQPTPDQTISSTISDLDEEDDDDLTSLSEELTGKMIRVPEDYSTIKEACNAAQVGDVVLVAYGVYYEYNILLKNGVKLLGNTNVNGNKPVINAGNFSNCVIHVKDESEEDTPVGTVIKNFEITGGYEGIKTTGRINKLKIINNEIYENNYGVYNGRGNFQESKIIIRNNLIYNNISFGIWLSRYDNGKLIIKIKKNKIFDNGGNGIVIGKAKKASISFNEVRNNYAGIFLETFQEIPANIFRNVVTGNKAGGLYIATLAFDSKIKNNVFSYNREGIVNYSQASILIENNIVSNNQENGIRNNTYDVQPRINYNDVFGNILNNYVNLIPGINDISADPMFVNPNANDYHLQTGSPCIDAGNPNDPVPDGGGSRIDIGAFEYIQ